MKQSGSQQCLAVLEEEDPHPQLNNIPHILAPAILKYSECPEILLSLPSACATPHFQLACFYSFTKTNLGAPLLWIPPFLN